jgi:U3 small nucleolar RNA-associated protein 20
LKTVDAKNLANEVLEILKEKAGVTLFFRCFNQVQNKITQIRRKRKHEKAILKITNPEASAKRKLKLNQKKQLARKRKIQSRKFGIVAPSKKPKVSK